MTTKHLTLFDVSISSRDLHQKKMVNLLSSSESLIRRSAVASRKRSDRRIKRLGRTEYQLLLMKISVMRSKRQIRIVIYEFLVVTSVTPIDLLE